MIEWFAANKLILNLEKTNIMKFVTTNMPHCALTISYKEKYIEEVVSTKFLGIHLDNHLNWKDHNDQIIPKLSVMHVMRLDRCIISSIKTHSSQFTLLIFILLSSMG
jgi:hypothetical protein